jgi:hypothetical protein
MLAQMKLSEDEIRKLNYKRYSQNKPIIQKRLHAVYMKGSMSLSNEFISRLLDVHRNSVESWMHAYMEKGIEGLTVLHYKPRKSELESYSYIVMEHFSDSSISQSRSFLAS